ncbi:MAG TPA: hypothetical protein VKE98_21890 [Gemmataceae bacterium]|nr:hypothetical protein [Gemmataceae bacterium]
MPANDAEQPITNSQAFAHDETILVGVFPGCQVKAGDMDQTLTEESQRLPAGTRQDDHAQAGQPVDFACE